MDVEEDVVVHDEAWCWRDARDKDRRHSSRL
jgi:hypothetical protein